MEIREDKAWLLQSRINPLPAPGALSLQDGRISFSLDAEAGPEALAWLGPALGDDDVASRVEAGETVVVFDHSLGDCAVTWPITGGGAVMIVRSPGRKWVVSYDPPSPGGLSTPMGLFTGRRRAKAWKKALAESGAG